FHDDQALFSGVELNVADLETGHRLAADLGDKRLLVLANHGLLTVGHHVSTSIGFYVLAERAAEVAVKARGGRSISDIDAARVRESVGPEANGWHVYEFLVRSRIGDRCVVD
ncbi:MAG: class II aldolase/adducin family protein, partial [Actinomycetota bacterium]|nr:class II aldolase/adducin family protein [Actinomycetota bacterium]